MKTHELVETRNVAKVKRLIGGFMKRTRSEQRGLALIYGDPGLGKTRMGEQLAFRNNWLYIRLQEKCSSKWFLTQVYARLTKRVYGESVAFKGTLADLETACIEIFADNPDIVMVIDEINLAIQFRKWEVLEEIRDFADSSFASFILMGEHDSKNAIERYNKHFFDRCQFFYQFQKNTIEDYEKIIAQTSNIQLDTEMMEYVYRTTDGNLRKLGKTIEAMESHKRAKGGNGVITAKDFGAKADDADNQ